MKQNNNPIYKPNPNPKIPPKPAEKDFDLSRVSNTITVDTNDTRPKEEIAELVNTNNTKPSEEISEPADDKRKV